MDTLYIKYNRERLPEFQTETILYKEQDRLLVKKRALNAKAAMHIKSIFSNYFLLKDNYKGLLLPQATLEPDGVVFDYVKGKSFDNLLLESILKKDYDGFSNLIRTYIRKVESLDQNEKSEFISSNKFAEVFSFGDLIIKNVRCLEIANIDLTFDNIIIDSDNNFWVIDYEWVFEFPIPVDLIYYRSIFVFFYKYQEYLSDFIEMDDVCGIFKLDNEKIELYKQMAEGFQEYVFGKNSKYYIPKKYLKRINSFNSLEDSLQQKVIELQTKEEELIQTREELQTKEELIRSLECELKRTDIELVNKTNEAKELRYRIGAIEESRILSLFEKLNSFKIVTIICLKEHGLVYTLKKILKKLLKKILPYSVKRKLNRFSNLSKFKYLKVSLKANTNRLLLVFPIIPWDFRWQRPQHIVSRFAQNGYSVINISMDFISKGYQYRNSDDAIFDVNCDQISKDIYQVRLASENPLNVYTDSFKEGDIQNLFLSLSTILKRLNVKELVYIVQFPGWYPLVEKVKSRFNGKIVFDCMDEHSGFSTNSSDSINYETELIKRSDLVITSSHLLDEKVKNVNNLNTILVKNGTEFEHFSNIYPNGQLCTMKRPIIGYYGAISDWFDMDIIEYCAKQKPEWNFVLIGSTAGCDTSKVEELPNIHLLGEKPYKELPGYLYYFDVCTIPFKIIPLTLATNPVKFYEYLSCGKPIVSVKLPELIHYNEYCYLADTKEEFLELIQKALVEKDNQELIQKRITLAKDNSWNERFNQILSKVVELRV